MHDGSMDVTARRFRGTGLAGRVETQSGRTHRTWLAALKVGVTLGALAIITWKVPWRDRVRLRDGTEAIVLAREATTLQVRPLAAATEIVRRVPVETVVEFQAGVGTTLSNARLGWLAGYFACVAATAILLIGRWRYLMARHGPAPPVRWCAITWARSQVINLLPLSQIGGDLYRIERASHRLGHLATSTGIVATERIMGLAALLIVAGVGCATSGLVLRHATSAGLILTAGVLAGVQAVRALRKSPIRGTDERVIQGLRRGPDRGRMALRPLADLARHPTGAGALLLFSMGVHLAAPAGFAAVDRALGFATPLWCYLVAIPALAVARYLPIHVAGIGIMEGGLWLFLGRWSDRSPADVIAISTAARSLALLWLGVLASAFVVSADPRHKADIRLRRNARAAVPDVFSGPAARSTLQRVSPSTSPARR